MLLVHINKLTYLRVDSQFQHRVVCVSEFLNENTPVLVPNTLCIISLWLSCIPFPYSNRDFETLQGMWPLCPELKIQKLLFPS